MSKLLRLAEGISLLWMMLFVLSATQSDDKECEVCVATLEQFRQEHPDRQLNDTDKLEADFRKFCQRLPVGGKKNRFCYFIGGTENAATGTLGKVIRPMSYGLPSEKICRQLKANDPQICELRFDVKPDFANLNKMKVGELRKILSNWGESMACAGCVEKADYIKVVRKFMPKYEPEEWKKLQAAENKDL